MAKSNLEGKHIEIKSLGQIAITKKLSVLKNAYFDFKGGFKAGSIYGPSEGANNKVYLDQSESSDPIEIANLHGAIAINSDG